MRENTGKWGKIEEIFLSCPPGVRGLWHWKSHWNFLWDWKDTETTLKNVYKGNHSDNPGLSHWNIFLCCSSTLKSHWKFLNHTEKFSALLISFVPRFFSVTLDFQCDFQCHNFIVYIWPCTWIWIIVKPLTICTCSYNQRFPKQKKTRNNTGRHDHITRVGDH